MESLYRDATLTCESAAVIIALTLKTRYDTGEAFLINKFRALDDSEVFMNFFIKSPSSQAILRMLAQVDAPKK